jgi:[FeFe] hydrogenase H-cluster maturation GTPase HydF
MTAMPRTSRGFRLHIGIFGRRNVGKSSLLNALTRQNVSIVSDTAGTTTDPVEKPMELLPIGPVLFIDTAGVDDEGALGELRIGKTRQILSRTALGIIVTDGAVFGPFEKGLLAALRANDVPVLVAFNKDDEETFSADAAATLAAQGIPFVRTSASLGTGIEELRRAIIDAAPADWMGGYPIIADLIAPGDTVVLVIPIDKEAPKGRLILPQVQTMRECLDADAHCVVVKDDGLGAALDGLKRPPALVVTDSQAFAQVSAVVPADVPLTGFSVLFSRFKGDLATQVQGALAVENLKPGDRILVAESCTHHPIEDDIGRVKIPRWLERKVGGTLQFTTVQGHDFPEDLSPYALVIHCGACMFNRRAMLSRIMECRRAGVPVTNYGLLIAASLGMLRRALSPFPDVERLMG